MSEAKKRFFSPEEELQTRRLGTEDAIVDSGNQMTAQGLSGEYYQDLDLSILPGSNTVIIGDNVKARQELIEDLAHARELGPGRGIQLPRDARIEYVKPAFTDLDNPHMNLKDFFLEARGIAGVEQRMTELWATAATNPSAVEEAGQLQQKFETAGGWDADREIEEVLLGLRLASNRHDIIDLQTKVGEMSSGQVSKAIIGRALFSRAGIIIMDDPSVHLDVGSKVWLGNYIRNSNQATIIATSDMDFAAQIGDRVIEILDSKLTLNIGTGLDNYYREREKLLRYWSEEADRRRIAIEELRIHIRDFLRPAARKTDNMAQVLRANETKLERMIQTYEKMPGKIILEQEKAKVKTRTFKERNRSGRNVIHAQDLQILYENDELSDNLTTIEIPKLDLFRQDRLAVVGGNGSGKSTLLKVLAGQTEGMLVEGRLQIGSAVQIGYYSPYTRLHDERPLRLMLAEHVQDPMGILAYWGFDKSENYDTTVAQLRYQDEIARAQFAFIMATQPNVLLLDEPTSYLTPTYQDRLLDAINGYDGTLLVVSHDPHFLMAAKLRGKINMPGCNREDL